METCATCLWFSPNKKPPLFPSRCFHPDVWRHCPAQFGCVHHVGPDSLEANVPQHAPNGTFMESNPAPVDGPTEILIVTHAKDLPWLELCLRSIEKFCRGFSGVTVAYPRHETAQFTELALASNVSPLTLHSYDEVPGKGMLQHMVKLAEADLIVPAGTKYVLTCDADCIFKMPTTPQDYFAGGKPYYIIRSWESLTWDDPNNPGQKCVSDCAQWKAATDRQVGFDTPIYGMCMQTIVFPIDFFPAYRAHVAAVHRRPFEDFMLDGRNEFPQSNMDFTAMGAYAHRFMPERFTWFDVKDMNYPADRKQAFWSHDGITPKVRADIDEILAR